MYSLLVYRIQFIDRFTKDWTFLPIKFPFKTKKVLALYPLLHLCTSFYAVWCNWPLSVFTINIIHACFGAGVRHHLLGTISPHVEFTAKDFRDCAIPVQLFIVILILNWHFSLLSLSTILTKLWVLTSHLFVKIEAKYVFVL